MFQYEVIYQVHGKCSLQSNDRRRVAENGLPHVVVDLGAVELLADITPEQHETFRKNY